MDAERIEAMSLEGVKVGDVIVFEGGHYSIKQFVNVESLTRTQVVTDNGFRFKKSNGFVIAGGGFPNFIARVPVAQDYIDMRVSVARSRLEAFVVTSENVDAVEAFLKAQSA